MHPASPADPRTDAAARSRTLLEALHDPARLAVLEATAVLESGREQVFDDLTALAAEALEVPMALISLVGCDRQVFKGEAGPDAPAQDLRETPLSYSYCRHVVHTATPLVVEDAARHPVVATNLATTELGVQAYAGMPVIVDGHVLGTVCALDLVPRSWSRRDLGVLRRLAELVAAELQRRLVADALTAEAPDASILRQLPDAVVLRFDRDLRCVLAEGEALRGAGRAPMDLTGRRLDEVLPASTCEQLLPWCHAALEGRRVSFEHATTDGRTWSVQIAPVRDRDGAVVGGTLVGRDVTDRLAQEDALRRSEERLRRRERHDPLTGLPNRHALGERLDAALAAARRHGRDLAVIFMDVGRLAVVNDSLGHAAGDELLRQVGRRLAAVVRADEMLARFDGDEFVVLAPELGRVEDATRLASRLSGALSAPFVLEGVDHVVGASIGIVTADGREDAATVLRDAHATMDRAKRAGGNRHELFRPSMREQVMTRWAVERGLRHALERGVLDVHYQPIWDVEDRRVHAVEALVRWTDPEHGPVPPDRFIPIAEETGLVGELGAHVLRTACRQVAAWERERPGLIDHLSVNISARQLADPTLPDVVRAALAESGLPAHRLALEITETALLDGTAAPERSLHALRALGARIVLDDFGTGYSSLGQLRRLPIDTLKVDRSFVDGAVDEAGAAIVGAIIAMARALNLGVVAEGVETEAQLARLRLLGCRAAQGYLVSRPLPADELATLLGLVAGAPARAA